jgi:hypothetical protein
MVSLLPNFDYASTRRNQTQLSGNFFDHYASCRSPLAFFAPFEELLDRMSQEGFPQRKQNCRKENGHGAARQSKGHQGGNMSDLDRRIQAMHRSDTRVAWAFVLGLWFAIIFVAIATWNLAPNGTARVMLLCAGAVILLFNTAAIMAMLRHYREDRDFMYGLDIKFLDAARAARR